MTNPTSNFGWQMPTSTDLVTDLPADFEVFGQAVDTSLADLKGGTTGQVLKKNSNTDMDFVWSADSAGMTNPMTTTGDTIYSSSGSTPARLGIGSSGQVLTVSGGVPAWATPATPTPTFIGVGLYVTTGVSIVDGSFVTMNWTNEWFDTHSFHSTTTNTDRITIPTGYSGKYLFNANISFGTNSTGTREIRVFKNGGVIAQFNSAPNTGSRNTVVTANFTLDLAVGDYLTISGYQTSGSTLTTTSNSQDTGLFLTYLGV